MANYPKVELYNKTINVKVRQSTNDQILDMAVNSDQNKSEVIRSLLDVGLKVAAIEKQRADQE